MVFGLLSLPTLFAGIIAAGFYLNLHRNAAAMSIGSLPVATAPSPGQRVLVLAPHCDDETLGVGGVISEARRRGVPVTVAFFTNGDGFRLAASLTLRKVAPAPRDYVRFGEQRQREALAALAELGVDASDVVFLGYPDQGLKALWDDFFAPDRLYRSRFTASDRVPFARAQTPGAPYCGESVVRDLARLMERVRPTDIYVTHPADDHADHCAAPAFTQVALERIRATGAPWASTTAMHYYIIHRGDWPLPQGNAPGEPLLPPQGMLGLDTRWARMPLDRPAREAKRRALARYRSQMEVMPRLLTSFLRTNELEGTLPTPRIDAPGAARVPDAAGDDIARFANPSADLTGLNVRRSGTDLVIRADVRASASPGVLYTIRARAESPRSGTNASEMRTPAVPMPGSGVRAVTCRIPLASLGLDPERPSGRVWISAETSIAPRIAVDRTGYRAFDILPGDPSR